MGFLPINRMEMQALGWERPDFVLVSGDAYVDHPSFGHAVISRVLEHAGFRVAILAQPDWHTPDDFQTFGRPRLGFLIAPGNIDSMVNHYTAARKKRRQDAYSPGGKAGYRPDRASIVYCNMVRRAYARMPIIIGGIEASLRRFAHYDYWDDKVRRSILTDTGADLLVYGMGESTIVSVAKRMEREHIAQIRDVPGSCYLTSDPNGIDGLVMESFEQVSADKEAYARAFHTQYQQQDPIRGKTLIQKQDKRCLVQNPPATPLDQNALDAVYELGYMRAPHPKYQPQGGVPAIEEVRFSLASSRGCFGGCSFCALSFHQGRIVQPRSHRSLLEEAAKLTAMEGFKGYIHDVGGPTANFRAPACPQQHERGACIHRQCLFPAPCPRLRVDHEDYRRLLGKLRALPKVKKVFVRSGIRFDYLMQDKKSAFFRELCQYHISGQLKVAPEHVAPSVLAAMGKPDTEVYQRFVRRYKAINQELGMDQYLVPYFISSHPGSDLHAAISLAEMMHSQGIRPEQVQDFYPTPGTISACMYYTGIDPRDSTPIHVPKGEERVLQRALLQYAKPENYEMVRRALFLAGREDLIGYGKQCLIRPARNRLTGVSRPKSTR